MTLCSLTHIPQLDQIRHFGIQICELSVWPAKYSKKAILTFGIDHLKHFRGIF